MTAIAVQPVLDPASALEHIDRTQKALEWMRVQATLRELKDLRSSNRRLVAWYVGREELLRKELGLVAESPSREAYQR